MILKKGTNCLCTVLSVILLLLGFSCLAQNIFVKGFVLDSVTGEPLIGAGVRCSNLGTATNPFGYYSLTIPQGTALIEYSYIGYKTNILKFDALRDTVVNIKLISAATLSSATVTAEKETGIHSTSMGMIDVPVEQVNMTPSVLGESDILKTLQFLPGVQLGTNGFTGLYVRGGGADENLLMLDGVALYNAEHMLGLFSTFMPESVKKVTLYRGSFPARYGGRLSSVLDIRTNDGNLEEHKGSIGISLLSSKIHLEGPLIKGCTSYSFSARLMHTIFAQPLIKRLQNDNVYGYWFYDINGKISHKVDANNHLYLNVYKGRDKLNYSGIERSQNTDSDGYYNDKTNTETHIHWGNLLVSGRWNHVFENGIFCNATLAVNHYRMLASSKYDDFKDYADSISNEVMGVKYMSGIYDLQAMADFDYSLAPSHLMKFGGEVIHHSFMPETFSTKKKLTGKGQSILDTTYRDIADKTIIGNEMSVYMEDEYLVNAHFSVRPGFRANIFIVQGKSRLSFQPRLSLRYAFDDGISFKAAYSRMSQNVHLLTSTQVTLPMDLWVPATKEIEPEFSDQFSVGAYYDGLKGFEFSIEGYYKSLIGILEYKDGTTSFGNTSDWQSKVDMGEGRSAGLELFLQKISGKTTGWISYTLAETEHRFPDGTINKGEWFPYKYDRRHSVNFVFNHKFDDRIDISGTWSFATGGVISIPERQTVVLDPDGSGMHQTDMIWHRGNYRLSPSHRLNIGINFRKQKKHGERVWTFSVYNLYNEMSPDIVLIDNDYRYGSSDIYTKDINLKIVTLLPILPSLGYTYNF